MATYKINITLNSKEQATLDGLLDAAIVSAKMHLYTPVAQAVPELKAAWEQKLSTLEGLKNKINKGV